MRQLIFNYLKFWANRYLKRTKPEIIAVTGSVGKTSAKEAIFAVLKIKFGGNIRKSEGNLNNETGAPLAILNYQKSPANFIIWIFVLISVPWRSWFLRPAKVLVLELAADKPGDIKYLTDFIKPKIAVLTAIGPAHLSAFGTMDNIIKEKSDLLGALSSDGWAVANIDNDLTREIYNKSNGQKKSYGIRQDADVVAENIKTDIRDFCGQTSFKLQMKDRVADVILPSLGNYTNVLAALAGVAVGQIYGMDIIDVILGLKHIKNEKHRMNVLKGKNNTIIIDDSYNANPLSMKAALDLLKILSSTSRKIAVLGEMREIGHLTKTAHQEIGVLAKEVADITIAVGDIDYGADQNFDSTDKAIEFLLKEIQPSDIILIKASRSIGLDKIVEAIRENPKSEIRNPKQIQN